MVLVGGVSSWDIVVSSGGFESLNRGCCTPLIYRRYYEVPGTSVVAVGGA